MDKYSRLLVHLSTVNGNKKDEDLYPSFVKDISVLESPNEELTKIIKDDLPTILPAILILSVHEDVSIRTAIARTFDTFCLILNKNPVVKNESWWKDMESKLISQVFSSRLIKMVEMNEEPWADDWAFVTNLIVHDEHVHGTAINSLLKVVETAFKMSKKNDAIMEKAYFCWNQLIDVFSKHPRVVGSQKLVELLVRPLSATHLSLKCPDLKMQTWYHLMKKIGFSCGNKCKFVMEPFLEFMYLKGEDSLYINYSKNCMEAFAAMIEQKKIYKNYALKIMSAFPACYNSCNEELEQLFLKIWTGIIDNTVDVEKSSRNPYLLEIFTRFHQVSQTGKTELNNKLMKILVEKELFNIDNLRTCVISELSIASVFSDFMKFDDFRNIAFPATVKDLMDNFSEANKKPQNNVDLQIWDLLCDIFSGWMKNINDNQEATTIDNETLTSLFMIPFIYKQWSVAVQKMWYSLLDSVLTNPSGNEYLPQLLERIKDCIKESQISGALCVEICTHITNKDKTAFKMIMPALHEASAFLPPKDSKPLLDMLVLLENAVTRVPKSDLSKFVNELMIYCNKYEHPYGLRIKTKISKVQRKLFALKENNEPSKEQESQNQKSHDAPEETNGCKTRSPIMAQSNFLQRLAKAEEKKKKKCPSMASIFGESGGVNQIGETQARDVPEPVKDTHGKENEDGSDKEEPRQFPIVNGRCSPALPEVVTILTPNKDKMALSKSPEPNSRLKEIGKKSPAMKMPPPPTYFEDDAQDFVVVPPKAKTTPLTEHQKEILSKRRTDIPALYQDLSQDTLTDSQSLKEIITLKKIDQDIKSKANVDIQDSKIADVVDLTEDPGLLENSDLSKKKSGENESKEENNSLESCASTESVLQSVKTDEAPEADNKLETLEEKVDVTIEEKAETVNSSVPKRDTESKVTKDIVEKKCEDSTYNQNECIINNCESSKQLESPQEIIENTPQLDPVVSLNLTPTKQPGPPTPRNLIRRITLIEQEDNSDSKKAKFIEDGEEEREKENIIINAKQNSEKAPSSLVKRRSTRKSSSKFSTKKIDDVKDVKAKTKKELTDPFKKIVTEEDQKEKKAISKAEITESQKTVLDQINKPEVTNHSQKLNASEEPTEISLNSSEDNNKNDKAEEVVTEMKEEKVVLLETSEPTGDANKLAQIDVLNEIKLHDNQLPSQNNSTEENAPVKICAKDECIKEIKEVCVEKDTVIIEENNDKQPNGTERKETLDDPTSKAEEGISSSIPNGEVGIVESAQGQSDTEESPSGSVSSWAMATPEKRGRKKKNLEKSLSPRFSPKQLRSKRLSLTKTHETPSGSMKKMRKSAPVTTVTIEKEIADKKDGNKYDTSNNVDNMKTDDQPTDDNVSTVDKISGSINSPNDSMASESNIQKKARKRKIQDESSQELEVKKKKTGSSSDEINQDSVLVVKNSIVKPRKKKILKSNVKQSLNNLEQWLIKSGKTVVKTSLISQDNSVNESESKVIEDSPDIQINGDESNNLVVEIPAASSSPQVPDVVVVEASPELDESEDMHNCTVIDDSSFNLHISISEDESITKSYESSTEVPLESLQCNETELPPSTSQESDESIGRRAYRRKRRLLKREETPFRESAPSPEEEQFDAKRERLTTPFRPRRRSAQMVKMATGEDEQEQNITPIRRKSISAVRLTENWPEGRLEEWVPCMPTPPGHSPSLSILRKRPQSPFSSPTSSTTLRKKRVSFLDPPVSKGLLYHKGPETVGQIQHADIPPGEKPLWKDEENPFDKPGPSGLSNKKEPINGGFEGEDELTAIQEFLNSTPDAPWSKAIPPELDVKEIPALVSSSEPLDDLVERLTASEEEKSLLLDEMTNLSVIKVSDISSIGIIDLNRLCNQFPKVKSLVKIVKEYLEEKASLAEPAVSESNDPKNIVSVENVTHMEVEDPNELKESEPKVTENEKTEFNAKAVEENMEKHTTNDEENEQNLMTDKYKELKTSEVQIEINRLTTAEENEPNTMLVDENEQNQTDEVGELKIEEVKSMEFVSQSAQTEPVSSETCADPIVEMPPNNHKIDISEMLKDPEFRLGLAEHIPRLLSEREFVERIDEKFGDLLKEESPFLKRLATYADYALIARLCQARMVCKENPG